MMRRARRDKPNRFSGPRGWPFFFSPARTRRSPGTRRLCSLLRCCIPPLRHHAPGEVRAACGARCTQRAQQCLLRHRPSGAVLLLQRAADVAELRRHILERRRLRAFRLIRAEPAAEHQDGAEQQDRGGAERGELRPVAPQPATPVQLGAHPGLEPVEVGGEGGLAQLSLRPRLVNPLTHRVSSLIASTVCFPSVNDRRTARVPSSASTIARTAITPPSASQPSHGLPNTCRLKATGRAPTASTTAIRSSTNATTISSTATTSLRAASLNCALARSISARTSRIASSATSRPSAPRPASAF